MLYMYMRCVIVEGCLYRVGGRQDLWRGLSPAFPTTIGCRSDVIYSVRKKEKGDNSSSECVKENY